MIFTDEFGSQKRVSGLVLMCCWSWGNEWTAENLEYIQEIERDANPGNGAERAGTCPECRVAHKSVPSRQMMRRRSQSKSAASELYKENAWDYLYQTLSPTK